MDPLFVGTYPIVSGRGHGQIIGARTLNFDTTGYSLSVETGIYAGFVTIDDVRRPAAIHYGPRPMLGDLTLSLEAHLIDVELDQSPLSATIELVVRLRSIETFPDEQSLSRQIQTDILDVKRSLTE